MACCRGKDRLLGAACLLCLRPRDVGLLRRLGMNLPRGRLYAHCSRGGCLLILVSLGLRIEVARKGWTLCECLMRSVAACWRYSTLVEERAETERTGMGDLGSVLKQRKGRTLHSLESSSCEGCCFTSLYALCWMRSIPFIPSPGKCQRWLTGSVTVQGQILCAHFVRPVFYVFRERPVYVPYYCFIFCLARRYNETPILRA